MAQQKRSLKELPKEIKKSLTMTSGLTRATKNKPFTVFGVWVLVSVILAYIGTLFGAVWVEGEGFETLLKNFATFYFQPPFHFIVGFTAATPKFIASFIGIWTMFYIFQVTKIKYDFRGQEFGSAHWSSAEEFSEEFANHDDSNLVEVNFGDATEKVKKAYPKLQYPYLVNSKNYWLAEGVYVNIDNDKTSNLNGLIVGPPGTGKSFRLARPILSQLCGNFVVTDPKGELYKQTGQYFEDNGYEVMVLNVESEDAMPMSIHFNPFRYIRNQSDIMSIAAILMKSTTEPGASAGGDQFFEQSAEVLLTSLLYIMHYYYPKDKQNWREFVKLLESTTVHQNAMGKIENYGMPKLDKNGEVQRDETGKIQVVGPKDAKPGILAIMTEANNFWHENGHTDDFPGYEAIEKFYNGAAETTSSIVASLDAHCRYMKLDCVKELLSDDEIKIGETFGYCKPNKYSSTGKRILYIVTSENQRYFDWITSMIYSLFFDELYHLTTMDPSFKETLPIHLTFLMDEFANITLPDAFVERLSTMRSRNMSAFMIVQNLIQLKRKFPNHDMDHDLIGNCTIVEILGAPDQDSCEYLSKMFGTQTIHKESTGNSLGQHGSTSKNDDVMQKPLFSAEEMYGMKKDGPAAIIVKGSSPLYENKVQFQNSPLLHCLCRKDNPYVPKRRVAISEILPMFDDDSEFVYTGAGLDEFKGHIKEACEEAGQDFNEFYKEKVIHLSMDEALALLDEDEQLFDQAVSKEVPFTRDEIIKATQNHEARVAEEKKNTIDFASFGSRDKMIIVQKLLNKGFTIEQIELIRPLIIEETSTFEELTELFNPDMDIASIRMFVEAG